jgi:hypothetical protein
MNHCLQGPQKRKFAAVLIIFVDMPNLRIYETSDQNGSHSVVHVFTKFYCGDMNKEHALGRAHSMHGRDEKSIEFKI